MNWACVPFPAPGAPSNIKRMEFLMTAAATRPARRHHTGDPPEVTSSRSSRPAAVTEYAAPV
jgi:hypothetical protein